MSWNAIPSSSQTRDCILRLPPELLATIFLAYKDLIRHRVDFTNTGSPSPRASTKLYSDNCTIPQDNSIARQFLTLTSVCRTFRNVVCATSQFWTHVVLSLHPSSACSENERFYSELKGLETWLSRSGRRHPLQIHITHVSCFKSRMYSRSKENDRLSVAVDMIAAHCERWEEVGLCLPWACLTRLGSVMAASSPSSASTTRKRIRGPHATAMSTSMPMLRKVALFGERQEYYGLLPPCGLVDAFSERHAPALEEMCLSMFHQTSVIAPWSRLRRFEGHRMSIEDVLVVLESMPLLEECTLANTATGRVDWGPGVDLGFGLSTGLGLELPVVHVPQLRSLTLRNSIAPLRYLVLPAMDKLVLHMEKGQGDCEDDNKEMMMRSTRFGDWGLAEAGYSLEVIEGGDRRILASDFMDLMRRSGCALQSLELCVDSISATTLMGCLKATPQLKELRLEHANGGVGMNRTFMKQTIDRLTLRAGCGGIVPLLRRLEVLGCSSEFQASGLADLIWSRVNVGEGESKRGCLDQFLLESGGGFDLEAVMSDDKTKLMLEQGINIKIDTK